MRPLLARLGSGLLLAVLAATAEATPRIGVSPAAFDVTTAAGTTSQVPLQITNTGDSPLHVRLTPRGPRPDAGGLRLGETLLTTGTDDGAPPSRWGRERASLPWALAPGSRVSPQLPAAGVAVNGMRVLILHAGGQVAGLRDLVRGFSEFQAVDTHDLSFTTPGLDELRSYDCVLVATGSARFDPTTTGDVLADYVDGGGGLVLTLASFVSSYEIGGRLLRDGYMPFQLGVSGGGSASLGMRDTLHPIMRGITQLEGDLLTLVTWHPKATDVARWDNGLPLVGTLPRVAAINLMLAVPGYASGQVGELLRNALVWSVGQVDWITLSSTAVTVAPGASAVVDLDFDATLELAGSHTAELVLSHDDPTQPELRLPVRFTVTGEPRLRLTSGLGSISSGVLFSGQGEATSHHLVVPDPHPDTLRLEVTVQGDFGDAEEIATVSVEGRALGGVGWVGGNCVTAVKSFPISRSLTQTLLADGAVDVSVSNSLLVDPVCPTNHHAVRLLFERPGDVVRFTPVFVGHSGVAQLVFHNTGTELLHVSGLRTSDVLFTAEQDTLSVPAGTQHALQLHFRPLVLGLATGALTFTCDDPTQPSLTVRLEGVGLPPPDVDATPLAIDARLQVGGSTTREVTIRNTGGSSMPFRLRARGAHRASPNVHGPGLPLAPLPPVTRMIAEDVDGTRAPLPDEHPGESNRIPLSTERGAIAMQAIERATMPGATVLLIQDAAPWATHANENVLSGFGVAFDVATSAELDTLDLDRYRLVIIASDQPVRAYGRLADLAAKFEDYVGAGGVLEAHVAGWGSNEGDAELLPLPGGVSVKMQTSDLAYIMLPGHPLAEGAPLQLPGTSASHAWLRGLPNDADVVAVDEFGSPVLAVYSLGRGMVVASGLTLEFAYTFGQASGPVLEAMISYSIDAYPHWLSFDPPSGEVPPGGAMAVTVGFQTSGLDGGDYAAELEILSEDPDEPMFPVAVSLHVDGAPDLEAQARVVTGESRASYVVLGARTSHRIAVDRPRGLPLLVELEVFGDYGGAGEEAELFVEGVRLGSIGELGGGCVLGRRSFFVPSTFADQALADGILEVSVQNTILVDPNCDGNEHRVRVSHAENPFPLRFRDTFIGGRDRRGFLLRNRGSSTLTVRALTTSDAQFRVTPATAVLEPRREIQVLAEYSPTATGSASAQLRIQSDDPDTPDATLTLSGRGLAAPVLETGPHALSIDVLAGEVVTRETRLWNRGTAPLETRWLALADWHAIPAAAPLASLGSVSETGPPPADAPPAGVSLDSTIPSLQAPRQLPGLVSAQARVLIIEDFAPWGRLTNEALLDSLGIAFDRVPSASLGATDLAPYSLVILSSDQNNSYYTRLWAQLAKLAAWVERGGVLEAHLAAWGSNKGEGSLMSIPGGVHAQSTAEAYNLVEVPGHPLVAGVVSPFSGTFASMGALIGLPSDALVVMRDPAGQATLALYRLGAGLVIAGTQPFEFGYNAQQASGRLLRNLVPFALAGSGQWLQVTPARITVAAGDSALVRFTLDTRALEPGDYHGSLQLTTNDPRAVWSAFPVELRVANVNAALALSRHALESGGRRSLDVRLLLPSGTKAANVDLASVRLNGVPARTKHAHDDDDDDDDDLQGGPPAALASTPFDADDNDDDGHHRRKAQLRLRFDRAAVLASLPAAGRGELLMTGSFSDGDRFLARDSVSISEEDDDDDRDAVAGGGTASASSVAAPERASLRLGPNPMVASGPLQLELTLARAGRAEVQVFSLDGRLVREVAVGELAPGVHALAWDGRDRAGRVAPAGVYLVRVRAPGLAMSKRVVRVR